MKWILIYMTSMNGVMWPSQFGPFMEKEGCQEVARLLKDGEKTRSGTLICKQVRM